MKLWLLRHGEAEPNALNDPQRQLTERGRREVRQSAGHLVGEPIQAILVSPYVRAQQTAAIVCEVLGYTGPLVRAPWIIPDADLREALDYLDRRQEQNLLLVTHQPFVGGLGGLLVHGHRQAPFAMATAGLAELEGESAAAGLMYLVSLRHPD